MTVAPFSPLEQTIGHSTLRVDYVDITTLDVDAIVSSDDTQLSMGGGVSGALRQAGGDRIWQEAQAQAPIPLGEIATTTAGQLKAKQIFHAAVIDYAGSQSTTPDLIRTVTRHCLEHCDRQGFHSIAFPALATSSARLSPEQSAAAILMETAAYLNRSTGIETVIIALYRPDGLPFDDLLRFYAHVSDFLDMTTELHRLTAALQDLETSYQELGSNAAVAITARSRRKLQQRNQQIERAILEQAPEPLKPSQPEQPWSAYTAPIAADLSEPIAPLHSLLQQIQAESIQPEKIAELEQKYRTFLISKLRLRILIQKNEVADLELELALQPSDSAVEIQQKLEAAQTKLRQLELEMQELVSASAEADSATTQPPSSATAITKPKRDKVFFSYSHHDQHWLLEFQKFLRPIVRNQEIVVWDDTQIQAGDLWREEIKQALAAAKVAVLLVSADFLASDFIAQHELPPLLAAAKTEGLSIIWVHISYCLYEETEIASYQAAHDPATPLNMLPEPEMKKTIGTICRKIKQAAAIGF